VADRTPPGGLPRPRKRFGQHFLRDRGVLARIADALNLEDGTTVIEIGPGRGALTDVLAERAARLLAIEVDRDLAAHLRERYAARPEIEIVEADVLQVDLGALAGGDYVLAGNVPYYITTPILFHALQPPRPRRAVYLVQKEVAERLGAAPAARSTARSASTCSRWRASRCSSACRPAPSSRHRRSTPPSSGSRRAPTPW
jgi:16S rRNA (adenine1518-N6/adenine1519-N6)-dimethyltransferase